MNLVRIFLLLGALAAFSFGASSSMENLQFNGRWSHADGVSRASAPASSITFNAKASSITFTVEGHSRWRLDRDGKQIDQFEVDAKEEHTTKVDDDGSFHKYRFIKISESGVPEIKFYGITLDGEFGDAPKPSSRRIEFIGDSFTVGYGCEGSSAEDAPEFDKTNASKGFAYLLASGFNADYQVNAFSGRGLVRNYDNIVPQWTLEKLYDYTVMGSVAEYPKPERRNFESSCSFRQKSGPTMTSARLSRKFTMPKSLPDTRIWSTNTSIHRMLPCTDTPIHTPRKNSRIL